MTWTTTYTGRSLNLLNPEPMQIDIRDIAAHLSRINRFNGASGLEINVACHSLNVARLLRQWGQGALIQMLGLLHDAHEAYIGDITRPMRQAIGHRAESPGIIDLIAADIDEAILQRFHLATRLDTSDRMLVQYADEAVLAAEWRDHIPGPNPCPSPPAPFAIKPLPALKAEENFLKCFRDLSLELALPITATI